MRTLKLPRSSTCALLVWAAALLVLPAQAAESAPPVRDTAKKNYRLYCMGCHLADGSGSPENGIPNMRGELGHFLKVPGGRAYLSQVPGMLNTPLNDAETAQLLNWLMLTISGKSTPENFSPYTTEEVAEYRARVPEDIPAMREKLIELIRQADKRE